MAFTDLVSTLEGSSPILRQSRSDAGQLHETLATADPPTGLKARRGWRGQL